MDLHVRWSIENLKNLNPVWQENCVHSMYLSFCAAYKEDIRWLDVIQVTDDEWIILLAMQRNNTLIEEYRIPI